MKKIMYIIISVLAALIVLFLIADGTFLPKSYRKVYDEKYLSNYNDINKITAYAIGAASSHNMQPWLVKVIDENTIELYADMNKSLSVIDEGNTQMLMSQGTFIARFMEGAEAYGYKSIVSLADIDLSGELPLIAEIKVQKLNDVVADAISSSTVDVQNGEDTKDINEVIENVMSSYKDFSYTYISDGDEFDKLQSMLMEGTIIESRDEAAAEELLNVFRWTEWDKNKYRYGLSLNTIPSVLLPFIQPIMKMSSSDTAAFGESGIKMFESSIQSDIGYILIKKQAADNVDYIKSGEIYQLLAYEAAGFSVRPAMQVLEKFAAMQELNQKFTAEFGADGEVLLIIRVQEKISASIISNPRHMLEDIIIE